MMSIIKNLYDVIPRVLRADHTVRITKKDTICQDN